MQTDELASLHPLTELAHPILAKAVSSFGDDPADDNYVGRIASSTNLTLLEIKAGQWRGGVWHDPELDVCWVLVAGLAKGGHEDYDDFYQRVSRWNSDPSRWMPTEVDRRLLKRERIALRLTEWELEIQQRLTCVLREVQRGGQAEYEIPHPLSQQRRIATVAVAIVEVRDDGYESDDILVDITPESHHAGSDLFWQATIRVLTTLNPPQQGWDRFRDTYSNIAEPGHWSARVTELDELVRRGALAESEPGRVAHYSHHRDIAESVVEGTAMRAMCGVMFVNTQTPDELPPCPECSERWSRLKA